MNGIEKIITHIEADTQAEVDAILADARKKSKALRAEFDAQAKAEQEALMNTGVQEADMSVERASHVDALEAKKQLLTVKQALVTQAFEQAAERITALPDDDYTSFLARLAADASRTGSEQIVLSARDKAAHGDTVCQKANALLEKDGRTAKLTLSDQAGDMRGGLILQAGDIEVNCTIETLIAQQKNRLSPLVADILFD